MTKTSSQHSTAAVVGGGIAGMTAAYRLQQAGFDTTVFESRDRVGGRIWTIRKGDFLMDLGTAVYLGTYGDAIALIHEIGLTHELAEVPATMAMTRGGLNHYIPLAKPLVSGIRTPALSIRSKLRALKLAADVIRHRKGLGYYDYDALLKTDHKTVREYCRETLDEELLQYLGRPLVSGTWVADDVETSVNLLFWTIRNMLVKSVYNLTSGVAGLPEGLATFVDTRLSHPVENVTDNGSQVEVTYTAPGSRQRTETFDTCVIAATAEPALAMYPQMDDNTRNLYASTRYRRLGSVCLGLARRPTDPATFYLISPHEDPDTIAVINDHHKAPGRAPAGKGLVTILLSHEYLERTEGHSNEQTLEYALERLKRYHGDLSGDLEEHAVVRWSESVPTIDRGRFARISEYRKRIDRTARVQFASDLDRIPGLNGGLVSGDEAATRVVELFSHRMPTSKGVFRATPTQSQ
ncbi:oxygen-dependent protoporphyrinogen oxidase [Haloechinothrix alba]|uniref:Oxygen-dependent protoporphyrinogen oxidase n=1 Tax=Haloechinothrix alba TaxID=664784 RepID=A0A239A565_9PSEU|nr:NAD(P)/FAD-dependent oxidoreductase [Haloechinothrix alba]SNR90775.1 oxygen-dependent protoporphyrinogen oxidase [Haloechinothrix alba]